MPISSERAAELLSDLSFLVGSFSIQGHVHGERCSGTVTGRWILERTWIEVREVVDGYEDLCLYGVDRQTGDRIVHHFGEGQVDVHVVLPRDDGGFHWVPAGLGPVVRLIPRGDGWVCEVGRFDAPDLDVAYVASPGGRTRTGG